MVLCDYGCGQEGKYILTFKKSTKNCCSKNVQSCPSIKKKNRAGQKEHGYVLPGGDRNPNKIKRECQYCKQNITLANINRH